ncbi:MAG: MmgE/PrpD family protein [Planctomycetota bacterium]|nr:MmgE/PrpD family protein [Planctomycetota bacterium]
MTETVTGTVSRWAAGVRFDDLSPDAVRECKRFLLDSLGCALGGYLQHDVRIFLELLDETAGEGPATVIGSGRKADVLSASLANALMVRVMDYNDIYWQQDPSHPSDIIPGAIACAERAGLDGRELCVGIAVAYEFEMRLCEAAFPGIRERGWHHATLTAFAAPLACGRMLGLNGEQIQHAIGIGGSRHATLGAVTAGKLTMMKNTVDPLATQGGVLAALLAEKGYSGPEHVLDGKEGLVHCLGPEWKLDVLTDGLGDSWRITRCGMKAFPTEALTHAPISAVLDIVRENELAAEDVESVHIRSLARAADILADPSKYDPRNKETADHSLPYVIAAALADGQVTPLQFTDEKIMDPRIRAQLNKVHVVADPEIEAVFPELQRVRVTITTTDGRSFERQLDFPKGDSRNPLSDAEIEEKFDALAEPVLSADARRRVKETIWALDDLRSVTDLMTQLRANA